jgi:hypothetical protein
MNQEETTHMLRELLQGVNVNQMNIVTGDHAHVSYEAAPEAATTEERQEKPSVPAILAESVLWKRAMDEGLLRADGYPAVSRTEAAVLAYVLADRLGIDNKWKVFEKLWNRNNMRADYNTALEQKKTLAFQDRLKEIFV